MRAFFYILQKALFKNTFLFIINFYLTCGKEKYQRYKNKTIMEIVPKRRFLK